MAAKFDLKGRIEDLVAWSHAEWPIAGPIELWAKLSGTPSNLRGDGHLEMQKLKVGTEEYDQFQSEHRWASGELTISGSVAFDTTPGQPAVWVMSGRLSVALKGGSLSRYPALVMATR